MKAFVFVVVFVFTSSLWANWAEDFEQIKNYPRDYEDTGSICEEIARLKFEKIYNSSNYKVEVGIAYGDSQRTIGELDIVVFDRSASQVVHVAEVKCWKDLNGGLDKAKDQRQRFLLNLNGKKQIYMQSTSTHEEFDIRQFQGLTTFTSVGQKGAKLKGYDDELEYDLKELHSMRMDMLRCQDSGQCPKAH